VVRGKKIFTKVVLELAGKKGSATFIVLQRKKKKKRLRKEKGRQRFRITKKLVGVAHRVLQHRDIKKTRLS